MFISVLVFEDTIEDTSEAFMFEVSAMCILYCENGWKVRLVWTKYTLAFNVNTKKNNGKLDVQINLLRLKESAF